MAIRTKAMKALSAVVSADPSILSRVKNTLLSYYEGVTSGTESSLPLIKMYRIFFSINFLNKRKFLYQK